MIGNVVRGTTSRSTGVSGTGSRLAFPSANNKKFKSIAEIKAFAGSRKTIALEPGGVFFLAGNGKYVSLDGINKNSPQFSVKSDRMVPPTKLTVGANDKAKIGKTDRVTVSWVDPRALTNKPVTFTFKLLVSPKFQPNV